MHLTPREQEKLMIVVAADLANRRRERGVKLNYPEAVALISYEILEGARDGRTVEELMSYGATILTTDDVMDGVDTLVDAVQIEATFPDGTKLVTVHHPIRPPVSLKKPTKAETAAQVGKPRGLPGEVIINDEPIVLNQGRKSRRVKVKNTGDRPVQVGSHYHFAEVNSALQFDRQQAVGRRLNIPAGTSARFEPGDERTVELVEYGGNRAVYGFHNGWNGPIRAVNPPTPSGTPAAHAHHDEEQGA